MSDPTSIASLLTQTITANARASANAKVEIIALAQNLQELKQAQNLSGKIVQISENNTVTIRTDQGEIVIRTDQAARLQEGSQIEIRIESGSPPTHAALRPTPQNIKQTQAQTQQSTIQITLPQTISLAQITNDTPLPIAPYNQNITQPYNEQIQGTVSTNLPINLGLVGSGSIETTSLAPAPIIAPLTSAQLTSITGDANSTLQTFATQNTLPFRSIAAQSLTSELQHQITTSEQVTRQPSSIKIESISPPLPEVSIRHEEAFALLNTKIGNSHAILTGFTENQNFAVLRFTAPQSLADQQYALQVPIEDIPVGTRLDVNILQSNQSPVHALPTLTASYFLTPEFWPIMQEIQQTLAHTTPQTAQVFNTVLPNAAAPAQLGTSVLFFVAAMRSGDVQGWLGDKAIDALKRAGKTDILGRLGREITAMARMNTDTISGDWRAMSLPLAWQNDINKIALYYRNEDEGSNAAEHGAGKKTRFIMDLNLSQIGKVQLDGLFIGKDGAGRLDLVLRTEQSFTQAMKQTMRQAYTDALHETHITGELSFQNHLDSWVRITPDEVKEYTTDV